MSDEDYAFESGNAGASLTYPMEAGALRKGGHCMLKGHPCKIVEISVSKTGKHGHAKCHIVGIDIFSGKKCEDLCPSTHNMEVPNVARTEFQLLNIEEEGNVSVLLENGDTKDDLNLPGETDDDRKLVDDIKVAFDDGKNILVTVLNSMAKEKIIAFKETAN
jgi:translation initiation factor 5A